MSKRTIAALAFLMIFPISSLFAAEDTVETQVAEKLATLVGPSTPYPSKDTAMTFLADNAEIAAPAMIQQLKSTKEAQTRLWILVALNRFNDLAVIQGDTDTIVGLLQDKDFGVQYWAIKALAKMKAADAVRPMQDLLASENYLLREAAAEGLGDLGSSVASDELIKLLADEQVSVRAAAATSLGKLKAQAAKSDLVSILSSEEENLVVKRAALQALESITGKTSGVTDNDWQPSASGRDEKIATFLKSI